ncbi:bestrophin family ion channel [Pseudotenacibaculum sp. MALMAid0570]|uniref:bestrophin family protein n=1 Tax=Pseudotenacibaculum sp. MALMAid0570 TaxID=3143938 RepID=UPI0032DE4B6A
MFTKNRYSSSDMLKWSRQEIILFFIYATIITSLYEIFNFTFLSIPWTPVALIGTALAFMVGFLNNSAYDRIWEARKIWGAIVNSSRTWGMKVQDMISNEHAENPMSEDELKEEKRILIYRHIAWLTALRYAMRQRKSWETAMKHRTNREWSKMLHIPERISSLEDNLSMYLSAEEKEYVLSKGNKQTALLYLQSAHIKKLKDKGFIWGFAFLELENVLEELFTHQGKSERIKNFPYPRQFSSLAYYLTNLFLILMPFGIISEFAEIGDNFLVSYPWIANHFVWLTIPFCICVSWAFHLMERIPRVGENPFEGTANDVPISTISRGIEINLREMLDEDTEEIPAPFPEERNVQM